MAVIDKVKYLNNRSSHGFFFSTFDVDKLGKICRQHWKERPKISKIAKFESDLVKPGDNIAPQSGENFTDVCIVGAQDV